MKILYTLKLKVSVQQNINIKKISYRPKDIKNIQRKQV